MFMTVFYMAASWIRARKLNFIRRKIIEINNRNSTISFYKITGRDEDLIISPTSSTFCSNRLQATVTDVLYYEPDLRACALTPQQIVNVSNWISFSDKDIFPIKVSNENATLDSDRLFLLVEADCIEVAYSREVNLFCLNEVGVPRAWRVDDALGVIVESDLEHLTKLFAEFTTEHFYVDSCFEVRRMQTVAVEGKPCELVHEARTSISRSESVDSELGESAGSKWLTMNLLTSPSKWKQHIDMFRTYSTCADEAAHGNPVQVPDHEYTSVAPGNNILELESPSLSNVNKEEVENKADDGDMTNCGLSKEIRVTSQDEPTDLSQKTSTDSSLHSTPSKLDFGNKGIFSSLHSLASASTASVHSQGPNAEKEKPPNVLIFAESQTTVENIKALLTETLHKHKYTIYSVTESQLINSLWTSNCKLLVIGGNVPRRIEPLLISYFVRGGKMFCLCSSFLHTIIPFFRTAEIRERELVYFSYKKWIRVPLLHSVFCYHKSTSKKNFSNGSDEKPEEKYVTGETEAFHASTAKDRIVFADPEGGVNQTKLTVLGHEETWQNSSLMLCESEISNPPIERQEHGAIVLSQVHLELGAVEGIEHEEILRGSEKYRKEIVKDILADYLKMEVSDEVPLLDYTHAYFLGMHDAKVRFIDQIRYSLHDGILKIGPMELKFVGKDELAPDPSRYMLPVFMYSCPRDFSTLEYFENLESLYVGRLVIYAEVLSSSMDIVNAELANGLAVVATQQTAGKGRSSNQWLSPPGCTMFSLQLHFPLDSYLGCHPSVLQHIVAVAVVQALSELNPDYKKALDLRLKWPNDIYHGNSVKLGGLIATCLQSRGCIIVNVGCGINLDNDSPTTCLNKLIKEYNRVHKKKLRELSREFLLAIMFTEIERMVGIAQGGEMKLVENMYYHFWLHSGAKVRIVDSSQKTRNVTVHGIDDFGFLQVRDEGGNVFTVHPDGNSFDMMEGLIAPKIR